MNLHYLKKIFKFLGVSLLLLIMLVVTLAILIQQPRVQTWAVNRLLDRIEARTGTKASLDHLSIVFPKSLALDGFYLEDLNGDTLLYAGRLNVDISSVKPFSRKLHIHTLTLDRARVFLVRESQEKPYNFEFLLDRKEEKSTSKKPGKSIGRAPKPFDIALNNLVLNDAWVEIREVGYSSITPARFARLSLDVNDIDFAGKNMDIDKLLVEEPVFSMEVTAHKVKAEKKLLTSLLPDIGWQVHITEFGLEDGKFSLVDHTSVSNRTAALDPADLQLDGIQATMRNIQLDSLLSLYIEHLALRSGDKFNLNELSGMLAVTRNTIKTDELKINLNHSEVLLHSEIEIRDFKDIVNSAQLNGRMAARIDNRDANLFLPAGKRINSPVSLNLDASGNLDGIMISELNIWANGNRLRTSGIVQDARDPSRRFLDVNIDRMSASAKAIEAIAPWLTIPEQLYLIGNTTVSGTLKGRQDDMRARLDVRTDVGDILTDLSLNTTGGAFAYSGNLNSPGLNLAPFLPGSRLGQFSGAIQLDGSGKTLDDLDASLNGDIAELEFNGYRYRDIQLDGTVCQRVFDGSLGIRDECIAMDFDGEVRFYDSIPSIDCRLHVLGADLQTLNFMNDKLIVSVDGDLELTGSRMENLNGYLHLNGLELVNDNNTVNLDTTLLSIFSRGNYKQYDLLNNKLSAGIKGEFDPVVLAGEVKRYLGNYIYYINYGDTIPMRPQQAEGSISLSEGFGLTEFFLGNVEMPDNLQASFSFDNTKELLDINVHSNYVGYKKFGVDTIDFSLTTKGPALLVNAGINGLNINNSRIRINAIELVTASTKDYITWNLEVEEQDAPNRISLSPQVEFLGDSMIVHFLDSYLRFNDIEWPFNQDNQIIIKDDAFIAKNFSIHNKEQYLEIINASSDLSDVSLEFSGLDLPAFASIVQLDTIIRGGRLSGIVRVLDPLENLNADIGLVFDSLQVFEYFCDEVSIDAYYDKLTNRIELAADLTDPNYDLTAIGSYDLNPDIKNAADLDINVRRLDLSFIDRILKYETDINAWARGNIQLKGTATKPILLGDAVMIDTARVHINFLGIDLIMIGEDVNFTENAIDFKSVNVSDAFGNQGFLEGELTHTLFKDMSVSATLASDNYNLLNTTYSDNEQFYGQAFGNGVVRFSGLTRNISIAMDMMTMPGTNLRIPLARAGDTRQYENIIFINPFDSVRVGTVEDQIVIKGVDLDFNLEVTPDAQLELVLNTESENNMIARGSGNLDIQIDQNKQLSIYGRYDIRDGKYTFSPQNLLNKRFTILNGSYLNWTGKPFEAELDVEAAYKVKARVDNILEDSTGSSETVPMDVIIKITGTLDDTEVAFDIREAQSGINNIPDEVTIFLEDIKDNEGEVTTQAIALLLVGRFLPSNTTVFSDASFSAGEFGKTTAFELISNQISNYLTDAISKLITEAELNFAFSQRENFDTDVPGQTTEFQVDFQTSFVNNRIIVKLGGNFEVAAAESTEENVIAGDFEVEGLLTKDGRLRGKAYHRTADYDIFNPDRSKTGIGISYQKDFDLIGEFFEVDPHKKARRKLSRQNRQDKKDDKTLPSDGIEAVNRED